VGWQHQWSAPGSTVCAGPEACAGTAALSPRPQGAMALWGLAANVKQNAVEGASLIAGFRGDESWRYIGDVGCATLTKWVKAGMIADSTLNSTDTAVYDGCMGASGNSTNCMLPGFAKCYADETHTHASPQLRADFCRSVGDHFSLNCDTLPMGVALYNQDDTDNCESWILVLVRFFPVHRRPPSTDAWHARQAANGYNRTFMWMFMLFVLLWSFLGVNIVADIFMAAIEVKKRQRHPL
jgi:hypothetical protein